MYDLVVVFSGPSEEISLDRLKVALRICEDKENPALVLLGFGVNEHKLATTYLTHYLESHPNLFIMRDMSSKTTKGNMEMLEHVLEYTPHSELTLVSSLVHIPRIKLSCLKKGFDNVSYVGCEHGGGKDTIKMLMKEFPANLYYLLML